MRTNAVVHAFSVIAVHAKHLVSSRELVSGKPVISMVSGGISFALLINLLTLGSSVIVDVVDSEEFILSLSTASANIATISSKHSITNTLTFFSSVFLALNKDFFVLRRISCASTNLGAFLALGHEATASIGKIEVLNFFFDAAFCATFHKTLVRYCHASILDV